MKLEEFVACLERKEIPPEAPEGIRAFLSGWPIGETGNEFLAASVARTITRHTVCEDHGMWAVIDQQFAKRLADWIGGRKVLEIMAGRGWLAKALTEQGIHVTATDNYEWNKGKRGGAVHKVIKSDAQAAVARRARYYDILLVSWPPYGNAEAGLALERWPVEKPVIYIGEQQGDCCADDHFFDVFDLDNADTIPMAYWDGIHDRCYVGYKQKEAKYETAV